MAIESNSFISTSAEGVRSEDAIPKQLYDAVKSQLEDQLASNAELQCEIEKLREALQKQ